MSDLHTKVHQIRFRVRLPVRLFVS